MKRQKKYLIGAMKLRVSRTVEEQINQVRVRSELHRIIALSLSSHTFLDNYSCCSIGYIVNGREESIEVTVDDDVKIIDEASIKVATVNNVNLCDVYLTRFGIEAGGGSAINVAASTSLTEILTDACRVEKQRCVNSYQDNRNR